jgi:outer membrane protein assembly factor BamB
MAPSPGSHLRLCATSQYFGPTNSSSLATASRRATEVADGVVYVGSEDGNVYAVQA